MCASVHVCVTLYAVACCMQVLILLDTSTGFYMHHLVHVHVHTCMAVTVDQEIFVVKIVRVLNFRVVTVDP